MTICTRRSFLATLGTGLAVAPGLLRARARAARYPIAFSTLGCPGWSWKTIVENADTLGYAALELRGIAGEMDLPKVPEFAGSRLAETKRDLAARGIVVSDLGASARMHEKDPAVRAQQFDEGRRFIDLAQAMGVKYVRMFGDKFPQVHRFLKGSYGVTIEIIPFLKITPTAIDYLDYSKGFNHWDTLVL